MPPGFEVLVPLGYLLLLTGHGLGCSSPQRVDPEPPPASWSVEELQQRLSLEGGLDDFERGAHARLGLALADENEFSAAWPHVQTAIEGGAHSWAIFLAAAQICLYWSMDHECVREYANQALAIRPDNARARLYLGQAAQDMGDREEALRQYQTALSIRPSETDISIRLANLLNQGGRTQEALDVLWDARHYAPRNSRLLLHLAAMIEPSDPIAAENLYLQATNVSSDRAMAFSILLRFYQRQGRRREAEEVQELIDELSGRSRRMRSIGPTIEPASGE